MIGILGGTFDPVHYGHLNTALEVHRSLGLERMIFVPAADPPHRPPPVAAFEHRLNMLKLVLPGYAGFEVDDREQRLGGLSYTVRTLESFREELGQHPLGLVMGADAFSGFESWHRWQDILELAHLLVMNRPGFAMDDLSGWARARLSDEVGELNRTAAGRILFVPVTPLNVSATGIRLALANDTSVDGMLPPAVLAYIETNGLYKR